MDSAKISGWLAVATNIAVLCGLLLVVLELNQNAELARVAMLNEGSVSENELWLSLMTNAPNDVIAKAVECPERLTYADYIVVDSYLYTALNNVYRNYEIAREGLFTQTDWKSQVDGLAHWYLSDDFSRTYWNEVAKSYFAQEFSDYVDAQLTNTGMGMYDAWQKVRAKMITAPNAVESISVLCR